MRPFWFHLQETKEYGQKENWEERTKQRRKEMSEPAFPLHSEILQAPVLGWQRGKTCTPNSFTLYLWFYGIIGPLNNHARYWMWNVHSEIPAFLFPWSSPDSLPALFPGLLDTWLAFHSAWGGKNIENHVPQFSYIKVITTINHLQQSWKLCCTLVLSNLFMVTHIFGTGW